MPGSSLWLIPPQHSLASYGLNLLINAKIPENLSSRFNLPQTDFPSFSPHVTITSGLPSKDAGEWQAWLERLELSFLDQQHEPTRVTFKALETREQWNMKLFIAIEKTGVLEALTHAAGLSMEQIEQWYPHASLAYNGEIRLSAEEMAQLPPIIESAGLSFSNRALVNGWIGGSLAVVETFREIKDWHIVASRALI